MEDPEISELIQKAKAGDREAFNSLVRKTRRRVYALALGMTGNEHDADEVVQDTYVRAFRSITRFREEARFTTWLHRIAANSASTLIGRRNRHRNRNRTIDDVIDLADYRAENNPEERAEAAAVGSALTRALAGLPQRLERVVVLRHIHGMSHREIAERLEISEAAAKVRLHRARARLAEMLGSDDQPELRVIDGGRADGAKDRTAS